MFIVVPVVVRMAHMNVAEEGNAWHSLPRISMHIITRGVLTDRYISEGLLKVRRLSMTVLKVKVPYFSVRCFQCLPPENAFKRAKSLLRVS